MSSIPFHAALVVGSLGSIFLAHSALENRARDNSTPRPVVVADLIGMNQCVRDRNPGGSVDGNGISHFSPNGKQFVVIVKRGDLERNTNVYSLLLFRADETPKPLTPEVLTSFASSSNRPGIQKPTWLNNNVIAFLAENPGQEQQLYTIHCDTRKLEKLIEYPTSVAGYAFSADRKSLFFTAIPPITLMADRRTMQRGIVVTSQPLPDLMALKTGYSVISRYQLFVKRTASDRVVQLTTNGQVAGPEIALAPDGRYLIVFTSTTHTPPSWKRYSDHLLQMGLSQKYQDGAESDAYLYELVDTTSGSTKRLIDAPIGLSSPQSSVEWSPDSKSVVVAGTFLPLDETKPAEFATRSKSRFVVQVRIPSGEIIPLSSKELQFVKWHDTRLIFRTKEGKTLAYDESVSRWDEAQLRDMANDRRISVSIDEGMNTPPKLLIQDANSRNMLFRMDLNPQFSRLSFGKVENISFEGPEKRKVSGGLYLPPHFVADKKYPLVIQTHGWDATQFWPDGPFHTGFAAQPIAGKGIIVLQIEEDWADLGSQREIVAETAAYEGAIDFLDHMGLIDRNRVGITAFSRTGIAVAYALTHSRYHFAAASLCSTFDGGYVSYLATQNFLPFDAPDKEALFGGLPYGQGLASWTRNSPGFNIDQIRTPIRLEANVPLDLTGVWELFIGLHRLDKPVDLIYLPEAAHVVVKPWDRMVSQEGNVDWYDFWLNNHQDPDPGKAEQYARWRELRKLQEDRDQRK